MNGGSNGRTNPGREPARATGTPRPPERDDPPARRRYGGAIDPPPPAREQLPLPRRQQQAHLEPQLRDPSGAGSGTPFAPFTPTEPGPPAPADRDLPTEFRDGSRRARRQTRGRGRGRATE